MTAENDAPVDAQPEERSQTPKSVVEEKSSEPVSTEAADERPKSAAQEGKENHGDQPAQDAASLGAGATNTSNEPKIDKETSSGEKKEVVAEDSGKEDEKKAEDAQFEPEDESKYLSGIPLLTLTFGLVMTTFVVSLDNTIIATAIPKITSVFNSLDDVGWYGSSYLLTLTSLQPSFGKVYTYFDVKWTFLSSLIIFEAGSILCAAATSSEMLIGGRAVAGAGAAAMFSGGMTIIGYSVPLRKRAIYLAVLSSMFGISSVIGPILGGAFTDNISWRWCFWINLPFGGIALAIVFFFFKNPPRPHADMSTMQKIKEIDLLGAFFLISAIVCLLLALQWGGITYPWSDSKVWGCFLGFGLLIIVFIGIQWWKGESATLPPRIILRQRTVLCCALFSALLALSLYAHIYYLPFYFQAVKGTTAEESGIRCIPYLISMTVSSLVVGGLVTALGPYTPFCWIGSAIYCVGCGMLSTLATDSSDGIWIGYQILAGAGAGACVQIPFIAVQVVLSEKDMPTGNAIAIFTNSLGGAVSVSAAQNIFSNKLTDELQARIPQIPSQLVIAAGATRVEQVVPKRFLTQALDSYNEAVTTAFILPIAVTAVAFIVSLGFEWKSVKGKKLLGGGV